MNSPDNSQEVTSLANRLEEQRDGLKSLLNQWRTTGGEDKRLLQIQAQQDAMLALITDIQKAKDIANDSHGKSITGLNLLTDAERKWKEAKPQLSEWDWLFKKESALLEETLSSLQEKLKGSISKQVGKILNNNVSAGQKAEELKRDVVAKAPHGDLAKEAAGAVMAFAVPKAEELAKANNRGGLADLWKAIRDATEGAGGDWQHVYETAAESYAKSGQLSKKRVAGYISGVLLLFLIVISVLLIFVWQPSEQFCLIDSVPCQPATRQAQIYAAETRAAEEIAAAQGQAADTVARTIEEVRATQTRQAELIEIGNANATATQTAVYAAQTREAENATATATIVMQTAEAATATAQLAATLTAEANAAAEACTFASGYAFEIVEARPLSPQKA